MQGFFVPLCYNQRMKKLLTTDKVYMKQSKIVNAGRGVYASRAIKKDEIIERCPVIAVPQHDAANLTESMLITYFYFFGKKKEQSLIALGFGSIYNHTYQPNAMYKIQQKEKTIDFIALTDIKKDTEITVNYKGEKSKNNTPLWFEAIPRAK